MAHAPKNDHTPPHIVQIAVAPGSQYAGEMLVALLNDGSLWRFTGNSWQAMLLPPPCVKDK